jgi:glycosyltransferase involved in cell wall biosynthesis
MKISIITVVLNSNSYIEDCINSVLNQTYGNIEYIVIDGGSRDGTLNIIDKYRENISILISEKDHGIYDAMNKGIKLASGDVIGILNSDDIYSNSSVLDKVAITLNDSSIDACYADLIYVGRNNLDAIIRYWRSCKYEKDLLRKGWVLPHPTLFVRKYIYEKYGVFDLDFPLAADFELIVRFLSKCKIRTRYIPEVLIKMRIGGETNKSITNILRQNMEILRALKKNEISISLLPFLISKLILRYQQYSFSIP